MLRRQQPVDGGTWSAVGGLISSCARRGSFTTTCHAPGSVSTPAWSSVIASVCSVLRIVRAVVASACERDDERRDVGGLELVDGGGAEQRSMRFSSTRCAPSSPPSTSMRVASQRSAAPVDRRRCRLRRRRRSQVGDAAGGELGLDEPGPQGREPSGRERAGERVRRVAAAGPVLDAVALSPAAVARVLIQTLATVASRPLGFRSRSGPPRRFRSSPGRCR